MRHEALEQPYEENSRPACWITEVTTHPLCVGEFIPKLIYNDIGEKHRRIERTVRSLLFRLFLQKTVINRADEADGHILKIVAPQAKLPRRHFFAAMPESCKRLQMPDGQLWWLCLSFFKSARCIENVAVEGVFQPREQGFEV